MRSLPRQFDFIVVANEEFKDLEKLKTEELQSSLEAYKMRLLDRDPVKHDEQALKAQHVRGDRKKFKTWRCKHVAQRRWKNDNSDEQEERIDSSERKVRFNKNYKMKDRRNI